MLFLFPFSRITAPRQAAKKALEKMKETAKTEK